MDVFLYFSFLYGSMRFPQLLFNDIGNLEKTWWIGKLHNGNVHVVRNLIFNSFWWKIGMFWLSRFSILYGFMRCPHLLNDMHDFDKTCYIVIKNLIFNIFGENMDVWIKLFHLHGTMRCPQLHLKDLLDNDKNWLIVR